MSFSRQQPCCWLHFSFPSELVSASRGGKRGSTVQKKKKKKNPSLLSKVSDSSLLCSFRFGQPCQNPSSSVPSSDFPTPCQITEGMTYEMLSRRVSEVVGAIFVESDLSQVLSRHKGTTLILSVWDYCASAFQTTRCLLSLKQQASGTEDALYSRLGKVHFFQKVLAADFFFFFFLTCILTFFVAWYLASWSLKDAIV